METVARFHKTEDAYLFRSYLESEGIAAHVFDEYIPQLFWHYTLASGGIRVVVADEDLETAVGFYEEYMERVFAGPAAVGEVKGWPLVLLASFIVGMPFILFGRRKIGNP